MWLLRYLVCTIDCLSYRRSVQRSEACTGSAPATAGGPVLLRRRQEMPLPLSLQGAPLVLLSVPRVAPRCVRAVDMHWARKRPPLPGTSRAGKPPGLASWQQRTGATMQSSPFVFPAALPQDEPFVGHPFPASGYFLLVECPANQLAHILSKRRL